MTIFIAVERPMSGREIMTTYVSTPQLAHDAIITSLWRQNDVATSFWCHNDVILRMSSLGTTHFDPRCDTFRSSVCFPTLHSHRPMGAQLWLTNGGEWLAAFYVTPRAFSMRGDLKLRVRQRLRVIYHLKYFFQTRLTNRCPKRSRHSRGSTTWDKISFFCVWA